MERSTLPPLLHNSVLTLFYFFLMQACFSQDCNTLAANKPSVYAPNFQNIDYPAGKTAAVEINKIKPRLAKVENWMRTILKDFTGAKLMYGNDYFLDPGVTDFLLKSTGLKGSYRAIMMFFGYYCYENKNKIETEDESGSNLQVDINNVFGNDPFFSSAFSANIIINGKSTYIVLEKASTKGRIDYYDRRFRKTFADSVLISKTDYFLIRNSDQPLYIPITRREYIQQLLKDFDVNRNNEIAAAKEAYTPAAEAANKVKFDEELKRMDNSKNYTPEQMAPYRKRFIETWETEKQKFDKRVSLAETETAKSKEILQEYSKKPKEWLDRGFETYYTSSYYSAKSLKYYLDHFDTNTESREDWSRSEVVALNPAYFNKTLGMDVPQVILVTVKKGGYRYMYKLAELIKKPGALAPLETILSPSNQPETPSLISSTSTYNLSSLPKLNKLTPLIVPADMKPSVVAVRSGSNPPVNQLNFDIPVLSPKLKLLPAQPFTAATYKSYVEELHTKIAGAIKPEIKKKAADFIKNKKLTQSKDISNTALAAWLQNTPAASLYLYSLAVVSNVADGLAANNFSAFLIMSRLPEKAIPVLEYWNRQQPGKATILANLGNAYYRLGDIPTAMKYLQQCVHKDSLNATANKLLCMMYYKKGDVKKAEEHGTRSITTTHDQQVISILQQLNNKIKPGEVMSRFPALPEKQFPLLERIKLPSMPTSLDYMEPFSIELNALKASLKITIAAIKAHTPKSGDDMQQKILKEGFTKGISAIQLKAQYIIMDGMLAYNSEHVNEYDVFRYHLKKLNVPFNIKIKAIHRNYNNLLKNLEGGEAGDEDQIAALELAKCNELNAATEVYLGGLSRLVNQYASRQENVSRKYYRDCANWAPFWFPIEEFSFPSIEKAYLEDVLHILDEYPIITKMNCAVSEPLPTKKGELLQWEDEYCANLKGKFGIGPAKVIWTCKSWGVEAGEGIVGGFEANYTDEGSFEDVSFELGLGASWNMGTKHIAQIGAGASVKEFVKIGPDKLTGNWGVTDAGVKGEIAIEGEIGKVSGEVKVIEVTAGYISGINREGIAVPILDLK